MAKAESGILVHDLSAGTDPRVYASAIFKPAPHVKGGRKIATACTQVKIKREKAVFSTPAAAALFLDSANAAYFKIKQLPLEEIFQKTTYGLSAESRLDRLFELFQNLFTNIVFSHSALEAYSNQIIPDEYVFKKMKQDKRCTEYYDKHQIERHCSLDLKISEILPEVTGVRMNKNSKIWHDYIKLKKIRDRIIHVKSVDIDTDSEAMNNIWSELLNHVKIDYSLIAHRIIKHFPSPVDNNTPVSKGRDVWIRLFPYRHEEDMKS